MASSLPSSSSSFTGGSPHSHLHIFRHALSLLLTLLSSESETREHQHQHQHQGMEVSRGDQASLSFSLSRSELEGLFFLIGGAEESERDPVLPPSKLVTVFLAAMEQEEGVERRGDQVRASDVYAFISRSLSVNRHKYPK